MQLTQRCSCSNNMQYNDNITNRRRLRFILFMYYSSAVVHYLWVWPIFSHMTAGRPRCVCIRSNNSRSESSELKRNLMGIRLVCRRRSGAGHRAKQRAPGAAADLEGAGAGGPPPVPPLQPRLQPAAVEPRPGPVELLLQHGVSRRASRPRNCLSLINKSQIQTGTCASCRR